MVDSSGIGGINGGNVGSGVGHPPGHGPNGSNCMIESHLKHHLEPVAQRHRQLKLWIGLGVCWLAIALVATLFLAAHRFAGWTAPGIIAGLIVGAAVASFIVLRRSQRWEPDFREVARKIEQGHPDLHALLLTAVE